MAENVHFELEQMVPELERFQQSGLFSKDEIKAIVKKRRDFEYKINSFQTRLDDFLRYVQYEINLEALKSERRKRLNIKFIGDPIDHMGDKRVRRLFEKCLGKYRGDLKLWFQYIDYLKRGKDVKALGKVLARAIQLHPLQHAFWSLAAWWEFEQNANVSAARTLFLRGLRLNNLSSELWLDYLRFELAYIARIKDQDGATKPSTEDSSVAVPVLPEESNSDGNLDGMTHETNASLAAAGASPEDPAYTAFLAGAIPRAVFRNAIATLPNDVDLRLEFLGISRDVGPAGRIPALIDDIYRSLETDFPCDARIQALLCERPVHDETEAQSEKPVSEKALREAIRLYERALAALPTGTMTEYYLTFLEKDVSEHRFMKQLREDLLERLHEKNGPFTATSFRATFQHVLSKVSGADAVPVWAEQINRLILLFSEESALILECLPVRAGLPESVSIRTLIPEPILVALYHSDGVNAVDAVYSRVLQTRLDDSTRQAIWTSRFDYLEEAAAENLDLIKSRFEEALAGTSLSADVLIRLYLTWVVRNCPGKLREVGAAFLAKTGPKNALLRTLISFEMRQTPVDVGHIHNLFEALITADAGDHDVWLEYIKFETGRKEFEKAAALYWRALKSVEQVDTFVASYEALK